MDSSAEGIKGGGGLEGAGLKAGGSSEQASRMEDLPGEQVSRHYLPGDTYEQV